MTQIRCAPRLTRPCGGDRIGRLTHNDLLRDALVGVRACAVGDLQIEAGRFDIEFTTDSGPAAVDVVGPRCPRLYVDHGVRLLSITALDSYHQRIGLGRCGHGPLTHDHGWAGSRRNELLVDLIGSPGVAMALPNPWGVMPLADFVCSWIRGERHLASHLAFQEPGGVLEVSLLERRCFNCHRNALIWSVDAAGRSACDRPFAHRSRVRSPYDDTRPEFSDEVRAMIEQAAADKGRLEDLSTLSERFSRALGRSYLSFGCPHCDALFGDHYNYRWAEYRIDLIGLVAWVGQCRATRADIAFPHWCGDGSACQTASQTP